MKTIMINLAVFLISLNVAASFSLQRSHSLPLPRYKRAIFDIIPSVQVPTAGEQMVGDVEQGAPGTRCICMDKKGVECVVDLRHRCRPLLIIAADDVATEQKSQETAVKEVTSRHVKKRLTNLVMRWIRMKDTERRLLKELNF